MVSNLDTLLARFDIHGCSILHFVSRWGGGEGAKVQYFCAYELPPELLKHVLPCGANAHRSQRIDLWFVMAFFLSQPFGHQKLQCC